MVGGYMFEICVCCRFFTTLSFLLYVLIREKPQDNVPTLDKIVFRNAIHNVYQQQFKLRKQRSFKGSASMIQLMLGFVANRVCKS